jgi:glycosyltransferase involved in cell wall biosynthesis
MGASGQGAIPRPLRIVHVAGSAEWGGGERYLELLARGLDRDHFALTVVLPGAGPFEERLVRLGIPVHVVDLGRLVAPSAIVRLAATLHRLAPDIVQSHGARSNFYARLAVALLRRPRHISTIHNSLLDYPVAPPRRLLYRSMDRLTLPLTARVLCVAEALAGDYRARVTVIPNGVDVEALAAARKDTIEVRRELGLEAGPVVGFAGRLTPQKDPMTFLRALAALRRELPTAMGLVVGDGPLRADLQLEAVRLGLTEHCVFAGLRADVPALLGAMDVFVLSSVSEGFPFVLLEAMAMGCPVVATAVNGVTEIVQAGVSGILVAPRDPTSITGAVVDLLRSPERARALGAAARARVTDRFSVERMIRQTEQLYLDVVASSGTRRYGPEI